MPDGNVDGTEVSVFSFWVRSDQVGERDLARLCECFGLEGASPVYVKAIDSTCPRHFSPPGKTR